MKAKIGNLVVDAWEINREAPETRELLSQEAKFFELIEKDKKERENES